MRIVSEYCCCAIPLFKSGIYVTLLTNVVLAVTIGVLAVATPSIVGADVPSFSAWIMAILCFTAGGIECLGLWAVVKEKTILYRRFTTLHCLLTIAIFSVAAVFIGWSGGKHNNAESKCEADFFSNTNTTTGSTPLVDTSSEGRTLCDIFTWVTFGVMIGLWAILGLLELYLYLVISGYGSSQRDDHSRYYALYSVNDGPNANDMFMSDRTGARRLSDDSLDFQSSSQPLPPRGGYGEKSYSDFAPQKQEGTEIYSTPTNQRSRTLRSSRQPSTDNYVSRPGGAYTEDPGPTPTYNYPSQNYSSGNQFNPYPSTLAHPGQ